MDQFLAAAEVFFSVMPAVFKRASRWGGGAAEKHGFPLEDRGNDNHEIRTPQIRGNL